MERCRMWRVLACLVVLPYLTNSAKVLFIPIPAGSHVILLSTVAEAWVKYTPLKEGQKVTGENNEAYVLMHRSIPIPTQYKNSGIKYFLYGKESEKHITQTKEFGEKVGKFSQQPFYEMPKVLGQLFSDTCESLLRTEGLFESLQKENFDFVVVDFPVGFKCLHAIPHRLGLPYGTQAIFPPTTLFGTTLQTNYLYQQLPGFYSKEPSFLSRFLQFIALQIGSRAIPLIEDSQLIRDYIKDKPLDDLNDLLKNCSIWFVENEPLVDVAKHSAPNIVLLGAISASPAKPLPADLARVADEAKHGLVVVSFGGSLTAQFPEEMLKRLLDGLGKIKQTVIIRLKTRPTFKIAPNIVITKWLPQNDLLGHKNTVLFVTHCGMSSVNEAVYHGVPMLGFPNQHEQRHNAIRYVDKNYGIVMDRNTFKPQELTDNLEMMLSDPKYKAIKKASAIIQGRRFTAGQEAAYWIDHVIKHGGQHLAPFTSKLAWYEILMYDIAGAIIVCLLVFLFILIKCCNVCKYVCCSSKAKQKTS